MFKPNELNDDYVLKNVDASLFEDAVIGFWSNFIKSYRKHIKENYPKLYGEFPKKFVFMHPAQFVAIFKNNYIRFYVYPHSFDTVLLKYQQFTTLGEMRAYDCLTEEEKAEKLAVIAERDDSPITFFDIKYGFELPAIIHQGHASNNPDDLPEMGTIKGTHFAQEHGDKLAKELKERFNVFNLEELVNKINCPSLNYELGESISAYKQGLYLAAATTGGIALENILRILIQKKTRTPLPKDTYIKDSLTILKRNNILSNRLAASVNSLRDIRNSNSHTNEDPVRKTTVDHLYATIEDLAMLL